jgi:hypothetical protein
MPSRKTDLERHLRESYALIREYEAIIQTSSEPKEKARSRRAIEEQWALVEGYLAEYRRLAGDAWPADIAQIAAHFAKGKEPAQATPPPVTPSAPAGGEWEGIKHTVQNVDNAIALTLTQLHCMGYKSKRQQIGNVVEYIFYDDVGELGRVRVGPSLWPEDSGISYGWYDTVSHEETERHSGWRTICWHIKDGIERNLGSGSYASMYKEFKRLEQETKRPADSAEVVSFPSPPDGQAGADRPAESRASLHRQLAEAKANLALIRERKSQYVLEVDVPLQLVKEERRLQARVDGLRAKLDDPA